jgi:transcriptional regulator
VKNTAAAKLTTEQVIKIKTMLAQGFLRISEIAREFGMTHSAIDCIAKGRTWRHVKAPPLATLETKTVAVDQPKQEFISSEHDF